MREIFKGLLIFVFLLVLGCGEKAGPTISFKFSYVGTNPFADPKVVYVQFRVVSVPDSEGRVLDTDGNGVPDIFGFPTNCVEGEGLNPQCGSDPNEEFFELSNIPLNFMYAIDVDFRNAQGQELYTGESPDFLNTATDQTITITVTEVSS